MKPDNIDIGNFIEPLIMQIYVDSGDNEKNHQLELNHETDMLFQNSPPPQFTLQ